jgi:opacity protein-like surface antigen
MAREFNQKVSQIGAVRLRNTDLLEGIATEQVGWAVGGGVQYQAWPAGTLGPSLPGSVMVGMELLYIGWPDQDISRGITVGAANTVQWTVSARYLFNTPYKSPY